MCTKLGFVEQGLSLETLTVSSPLHFTGSLVVSLLLGSTTPH